MNPQIQEQNRNEIIVWWEAAAFEQFEAFLQ